MIDVASFGWPQWLYLAWIVFSMVVTASKNGEYVQVKGGAQIVITLTVLTVLACGGFFA